jgi:hypothetical protein
MLQDIMDKAVQGRPAFTPASGNTPQSSPPLSGSATPPLVPQGSQPNALPVTWQPLWVVRYNVIDARRSIVDNIGYIIGARYTV